LEPGGQYPPFSGVAVIRDFNGPGEGHAYFRKRFQNSRESTLLPGILSKHVKHNRNVECGHCQGINFVARHALKACKTHRNVECGHSQENNSVTRHHLKACKTQ
jgi:hypothetical protein